MIKQSILLLLIYSSTIPTKTLSTSDTTTARSRSDEDHEFIWKDDSKTYTSEEFFKIFDNQNLINMREDIELHAATTYLPSCESRITPAKYAELLMMVLDGTIHRREQHSTEELWGPDQLQIISRFVLGYVKSRDQPEFGIRDFYDDVIVDNMDTWLNQNHPYALRELAQFKLDL